MHFTFILLFSFKDNSLFKPLLLKPVSKGVSSRIDFNIPFPATSKKYFYTQMIQYYFKPYGLSLFLYLLI